MTARQLDLPPGASSRTTRTAPAAGTADAHRPPIALLYLDVVVLAIATIPALVLGAPALGYLIAAGAWLFQRALAEFDRRWVGSARTPQNRLGRNLFERFGRIWLLAGAIVVAGVAGGRADGLTAAVTIFVAYSVAFALRLVGGRPERAVGR